MKHLRRFLTACLAAALVTLTGSAVEARGPTSALDHRHERALRDWEQLSAWRGERRALVSDAVRTHARCVADTQPPPANHCRDTLERLGQARRAWSGLLGAAVRAHKRVLYYSFLRAERLESRLTALSTRLPDTRDGLVDRRDREAAQQARIRTDHLMARFSSALASVPAWAEISPSTRAATDLIDAHNRFRRLCARVMPPPPKPAHPIDLIDEAIARVEAFKALNQHAISFLDFYVNNHLLAFQLRVD